jgi:hypothetical protein
MHQELDGSQHIQGGDYIPLYADRGLCLCLPPQMRRSGELYVAVPTASFHQLMLYPSAKYGLATINKMLDIFGADQVVSSDIACSFRTTVSNSSIGPKAVEQNLRLIVNTFHGHAHNRLCQLKNHLIYSTGMGLKDLKTCKQVFASSNAVAQLVQHASYFHWLQFIDLHYDQWDHDKYLELSTLFPASQGLI